MFPFTKNGRPIYSAVFCCLWITLFAWWWGWWYNLNIIFKNISMAKKEKKLKYEKVDRVSRWNYCQQIASLLYNSDLTEKELQEAVITFKFNNKQLY